MHGSTGILVTVMAFICFLFTETAVVPAAEPADINISKCPKEDIKDARKHSAKEQAAIAPASGKAARKGTRLELKTSTRTVVLDDDCTNGEPYVRYTFKSFIPEGGYYLIAVTGWEGSGYMLVNERTGDKNNIEGSPVFSPDRKLFVSMSIDLEAGENPNSIQIWRITSGGLKQELNFDTDNAWGPSDPVWKDNGTIAFKKNFFVKPGAEFKSVPALLIQKGDTWEIR